MLVRTSSFVLMVGALLFGGCGNDNPPTDTTACPADASGAAATLRLSAGQLCGTLQMPAGSGPVPVALIAPGSGPTDRNGNDQFGTRTDVYRELAAELALRGVASLRYDKRGIGASSPVVEANVRPSDFADDIAGWLEQLKADARFSAVILMGHSEGSLLGILAMQRVSVASFISLAGPGRSLVEIFRDQLAQQPADPNDPTLLQRANQILDQLAQGQMVNDIPAALWSAFRPSVQPYLIALFQYEPANEFARLSGPALIAQGTTDAQVSVADAQALAAARPDAQVLFVDGMGHFLKMTSIDRADQLAALHDPSRPIAPALLEGINAFLRDGDHGPPGG